MNTTENAMFQRMIRYQRFRNAYDWPGKAMNAPAVTRYPNIVAELEVSGMYLWCPAEHAGVSKEIMTAVMEDAEELTVLELFGRCSLYGCKKPYISAPAFQMVNPTTNKGKARRRVVADLLEQTDGLDCLRWRVENVFSATNSGKTVTYASWRRAVGELQDAVDRQQKAQQKPRSVRMAGAEGEG